MCDKCGDCLWYENTEYIIIGDDDDPDGQCNNGNNWKPSRGELPVHHDDEACGYFEPISREDD